MFRVSRGQQRRAIGNTTILLDIGYESVGVERDRKYFNLAIEATPKLSKLAMKPD